MKIKNILLTALCGMCGSVMANNFSILKHWAPYGNKNAFSETEVVLNLVMDQSETAYLAGLDEKQTLSVVTLNKNTNTWVSAGNSISSVFTGGSLAIDKTKEHATPYISYAKFNSDGISIFVDQLENGQWTHVGNGPIATTATGNVVFVTGGNALAITDQNGIAVPYALYETCDQDYTCTIAKIVKFNGTNWIQVGNTIQNEGMRDSQLALDKNGIPYLALDIGGNVSVMKLMNNVWQMVGPIISNVDDSGGADFAFAINPITNTSYLTYLNKGEGKDHLTVIRFNQDTDHWETVGNKLTGDQYQNAIFPTLTFSSTGQPYIAFQASYAPEGKNYILFSNNVMQLNQENQWDLVGNANDIHINGPFYTAKTSLVLDAQDNPFFSHMLADTSYDTVETLVE